MGGVMGGFPYIGGPVGPQALAAALGLTKNVVRDYGAVSSTDATTGDMTAGEKTLTVTAAEDFANGQGIYVDGATQLADPSSAPTLSQAAGSSSFTTADAVYVAFAWQDGSGNSTKPSAAASIAISAAGNTVSFTEALPSFGKELAVYADTSSGPALLGTIDDSGNITYSGSATTGLAVALQDSWKMLVTISAPQNGGSAQPSSNTTAVPLLSTIASGGGTTALTLNDAAALTVTGATVEHDNTAAIQSALNAAANNPVYIPDGTFMFDRLSLPVTASVNMRIMGASYSVAVLKRHSASTGHAITDQGNATGIQLENFNVDCNGAGGDGINLGFGTYALNFGSYLQHVMISHASSGAAVHVNVNVATMYDVWAESSLYGIRISGSVFYGYLLSLENNTTHDVWVDGGDECYIWGVQTESSATTPLYLDGYGCLIEGIYLNIGANITDAILLSTSSARNKIGITRIFNGGGLPTNVIDWESVDTVTYDSLGSPFFPGYQQLDDPLIIRGQNNATGNTGLQLRNATLSIAAPSHALSGTTAGTLTWVMSEDGLTWRGYLDGYENTTATAQTVTYPTAFANGAAVVSQPSGFGATTTATTLTLPESMSAAVTGVIIVMGL